MYTCAHHASLTLCVTYFCSGSQFPWLPGYVIKSHLLLLQLARFAGLCRHILVFVIRKFWRHILVGNCCRFLWVAFRDFVLYFAIFKWSLGLYLMQESRICTVVPSICRPSVWDLLHVTIRNCRILRWLRDFEKFLQVLLLLLLGVEAPLS